MTISVRTGIPKSAGDIISFPGLRGTAGWGAFGVDLGAPSGSYPGKTCGQANCTMGCCPSGFGMNGVVDVNASAPVAWPMAALRRY